MRVIVQERVGETRAAVVSGERVCELHVERWSERKTRAIRGEIYLARVRTVDDSLNGAFCDLGKGPEGFLPFGAQRPSGIHEGAAIPVQIGREAFGEKGPTLNIVELDEVHGGDAPECLVPAPSLAERLSRLFEAPIRKEREADFDMDAEFDMALDKYVPLQGGGRLIIEPTAAMTTIDVDSAGRSEPKGGAGRLAVELNKVAAREACRQIRLRGIGGVVAIDFLPLKKKADQSNLHVAVKSNFRGDLAKIDVAPLSRFAIMELARQRITRSLYEVLLDASGRLSVESCALGALAQLEREARANSRKPMVTLKAGKAVFEWLDRDTMGWRKAMTARLGARFELVLDDAKPERAYEAVA
ncbi:ribonuclease E/G [Woodsholea maritima]|uniref:ribonuclease E/G n=1 Tax=Woodsholea maritima TaxID=240237 RepID=UPI0003745894|nr:ribonuclease E/G [Woodsholea maritima]